MAVKTIMPISMVSPIAISGLKPSISVLGSRRRRHSAWAGSPAPWMPPIIRPISSMPRLATGRGADNRPSLMTQSRSASSKQFVEILRDHHHRRPRRRGRRVLPDRGGGAGIDAPGRLGDDEHGRLLSDLAADDEFLQVAARERAGGHAPVVRRRRA
jgi:hypothetical protein